jgi:hypothetical protein
MSLPALEDSRTEKRVIDDETLDLLLLPGSLVESSGRFTQADIAAFERLGIPPELLDDAQVRRVSDREARDDYGITASATADLAGIVFP